jgi:hypothetical protein
MCRVLKDFNFALNASTSGALEDGPGIRDLHAVPA